MKVLEIGAGCGYSAAVAAKLISPGGKLFSIEIVPELADMAARNLERLGLADTVRVITGDGSVGLPAEAPFDRIYLTAGVGQWFDENILLDQLTNGGILLYPESHGSMYLIKKTKRGLERNIMGGVAFVFLKGRNSGYR
jgi:protein-L-isoaspartate(D-aspartate) O-methyltransferase